MQVRRLRQISAQLKERCDLARPYHLTFYNHEAHVTEPITETQRQELEKHLAYHFHNIWARSWILPLAAEILECIGDAPKGGRNG